MVTRLGIERTMPSPRSLTVIRRNPVIVSPQGRVNGNLRRTNVMVA